MNQTILSLSGIAVGAALIGAVLFAPRAEVETQTEIAASPERVWAVLTDTAAYPRWNPFIVSVTGKLEEGETLVNILASGDGRRMRFRPTVTRVVPRRELVWLGRLILPRLLDGEHRFVLVPTSTGTRLFHSERFRGLALPLLDVRSLEADFEAMNMALKLEAESNL